MITGAGSGIGQLLSYEFSKLGSTLVLWDVNQKGLEQTAGTIQRQGGRVFFYVCDVTNAELVYQARCVGLSYLVSHFSSDGRQSESGRGESARCLRFSLFSVLTVCIHRSFRLTFSLTTPVL